jgi:ComF family protein
MSVRHLSNFRALELDSPVQPRSPRGRIRPWTALAALCRAGLPQSCALCATPCADRLVCSACTAALPHLIDACPLCALPARDGAICGTCLRRPPPFTAAVAAFVYAFPLDRLLHAFKYGGRLAYADFFASALAERLAARAGLPLLPDVVVALPLAPARQRERGFDQARELARRVANIVGAPLGEGLVRTRETPPQATQPWQARARNIRGAFAADASLAGRRIALLDDVMTTGATLAAAAGALLQAGAAGVEVWVIARTLPPSQSA